MLVLNGSNDNQRERMESVSMEALRNRATMTYLFERVVVMTFPGLTNDALLPEFDMPIVNPPYSCTVSIVASLANCLHHADHEQAVRAGMLQAVTYKDEKFKNVLAEVQASRPRAASYVVITVRGPAELDMSQTHRDMGEVVVGFDLAEKDNYRRATEDVIAAVSTKIGEIAHPASVKKIVDSVYFFDESGRPYYVSNPRFGNASITSSWDAMHNTASLLLQAVITPGPKTDEGQLIEAVALPWFEIIEALCCDPSLVYQIKDRKWEEIIAGAYHRAGFDEVTLTPHSGDFGRDVIAIKRGIGTIRIIDQVKAYGPKHLVTADDVRALLGVVEGDKASKGFLTTTSDFAPKLRDDILLRPYMPARLELINGKMLLAQLKKLAKVTD